MLAASEGFTPERASWGVRGVLMRVPPDIENGGAHGAVSPRSAGGKDHAHHRRRHRARPLDGLAPGGARGPGGGGRPPAGAAAGSDRSGPRRGRTRGRDALRREGHGGGGSGPQPGGGRAGASEPARQQRG